jgi:hypothetical protein
MPNYGYLACFTCMVHCRNPASFALFSNIKWLSVFNGIEAIGQSLRTHYIGAYAICDVPISRMN